MGMQNPRPKLETLKPAAAHKVDSRMAPGTLKSEDPALLLFLYLKPEDPLCVWAWTQGLVCCLPSLLLTFEILEIPH